MDKTTDTNTLDTAWGITCKRYVAFIDIMGFKDLVARNNHEDIYTLMKKMHHRRKMAENIQWGQASSKLVTTTTYSDSIIMYSKDDTYNSMYSLICAVSALTNDLLIDGIPHKGAVAFGILTLDHENSIFFGQPLIDAYLLQEEINFYGIIMHGTAEEELNSHKKVMPFTKYYSCPFKVGYSNHLTIHPIFLDTSTPEKFEEQRKGLFNSVKKFRFKTSGHLRKYIDNTDEYLKAMDNSIQK